MGVLVIINMTFYVLKDDIVVESVSYISCIVLCALFCVLFFLVLVSLSIMLIISSLLAIPLSLRMAKIGRFTMILSGLVIFLTYYGLVQGQKILVFESSFSSFQVFSISHFIFVTIWLLLFGLEQYRFELGNFMMARNSKKFFIQAFFLTALVFFLLNILYFNF